MRTYVRFPDRTQDEMTGHAPRTSRREIAVGLAALLLLLALVVLLGWGLFRALDQLKSGVAAAVVTASATVLISVFSLIFSKRWEQRRFIDQANREHKLPVYDEFIRFWFRVTFSGESAEDGLSDDDFKRFVAEFSQKLALWASDDVLQSYNRFRSIGSTTTSEDTEVDPSVLFAFEQMLFEIRRDLGHENNGLGAGDLLRLFINDVDDFLPAGPATQ